MEELINRWDEIKESIRKEHSLTDISYETWILPLKLYGIENNTVIILIPSDQAQSVNYISNKYLLPFRVAISEALGRTYDVDFILEKDIKSRKASGIKNNVRYEKTSLNPSYTFDTFVVGENNRLAHSAALAVSESPGDVYNPLFLYGGVGLGKTHLMHSIGNYIFKNINENVLYVTSEVFTNEVIEAIRIGNTSPAAMKNFREKYRNVDVLLIDDIQFIIGKESTQEEFFHTFNQLHEEKKQIIISSDRPPKDMDVLEERYKSRFGWGLIVDMQTPNYETRMAILRNKMDSNSYSIDESIIRYIAENITTNIRDLEGALNKINAYSKLENREVDMELAKNALKDVISPKEKNNITPEYIIDVVCDQYNIDKQDIFSKKRISEIVIPRQVIMYLCIKKAGIASTRIEKILKKDHSTIFHGANKVESDMEYDKELKLSVDTLVKKLNL